MRWTELTNYCDDATMLCAVCDGTIGFSERCYFPSAEDLDELEAIDERKFNALASACGVDGIMGLFESFHLCVTCFNDQAVVDLVDAHPWISCYL